MHYSLFSAVFMYTLILALFMNTPLNADGTIVNAGDQISVQLSSSPRPTAITNPEMMMTTTISYRWEYNLEDLSPTGGILELAPGETQKLQPPSATSKEGATVWPTLFILDNKGPGSISIAEEPAG